MTLEQIDARLKTAEQHNAQLATRKAIYAERIKKEFGADSVDDLKKLLEDAEKQLAKKNREYEDALAAAEAELRKAGITC